jgi:hypothetical protein
VNNPQGFRTSWTSTAYTPIVSFQDGAGSTVVAEAPVRVRRAVAIGTPVSVLYHPQRPTALDIVDGPGTGNHRARPVAAAVIAVFGTAVASAVGAGFVAVGLNIVR